MAEFGVLGEVRIDKRTTSLTAAASVSDTELFVDSAGDLDEDGGTIELNGVELEYSTTIMGDTDDDPDTVILVDPLAVAADVDDQVTPVIGGLPAEDWYAIIDQGAGDPVPVPLTFAQRQTWAPGLYDPPVPVIVSEDLQRLEDAPGRPVTGTGRTQFLNTDTAIAEGPGDLPIILTRTPIEGSEHVVWNFSNWVPPTDWSRVGKVLTVADAGDFFRTGDVFTVAYAYDSASGETTTPLPDSGGGTLVAFEASGWKWKQIARGDATDYSAAAFDDSAWTTAAAAFGDGGDMIDPALPAHSTLWQKTTRMWARRTLTGMIPGQAITGLIRADESSVIYLGGVSVWTGTPNGNERPVLIDGAAVTSSSMVLAVRTTDGSSSLGCYFDLELTQ